MAVQEGVCRLCRRQAGLIAGRDNHTRVDLTVAARTGHQLFIIGTLRPRGGRPPGPQITAAGSPERWRHRIRPRWMQPPLFETARDLRGVSSRTPLLDPELAGFLEARAGRIAELRGWPPRTLGSVRRGIRILCAIHEVGEPVRASTIAQLTHTAIPSNHVLEVFQDLDVLVDDRPDSVHLWCDERLSFLADGIRAEVDAWVSILRNGNRRRSPRARSTVITQLGLVRPFLRERTAAYTTLRQVTRDDVTTWLSNRPNRVQEASALRSLFGVLKKEKLVFANPMRGVTAGKPPTSIPVPLTDQEVAAVAGAARQDLVLRTVVALAGIHAMRPHLIRTLLRGQVDLAGRRLDPDGWNHPLDDYTAEAISDYLAYRHERWPNSTNPHLLITRNTATTTAPVGTFWLDRLVQPLPVALDRLRQDRILEEAAATGADPLHLAHVFALGGKSSLRYTQAVAASAAELSDQ
ncbi:Site-specific recombinase XerD [Actinacidiphila yanglinensis]|uniref:Site-specific recombinase XerD n=1 Tax=Actinacidiphila yanglinensis TaxID=310779 RepID=A0A1H6DL56_9ACTN|nr:hypothetical protein [Actinacidiphila yanglinensis]SEG85325.1 Site-specific recombinase XerD [Actinacidiphila yanglinensis]